MHNEQRHDYEPAAIGDQGDILPLTNGSEGDRNEKYVVWGNDPVAPPYDTEALDE